MDLSAASLALFRKGIVGDTVLKDNKLPADIFPGDGSWNQFPDISVDQRTALRTSAFGSHLGTDNKTCISARTPSNLSKAFTHTNASALRFSPNHRMWSSVDSYAVNQRLDFGCSLLMTRISDPNGQLSKPLLIVTGPLATSLPGFAATTRDLFQLDPEAPLPSTAAMTLPEQLSPSVFSLHPTPRLWAPQISSGAAQAELSSHGHCLSIASAHKLHSPVFIFDASKKLAARNQKDKLAALWNLSFPRTHDSVSQFLPTLLAFPFGTLPATPFPIRKSSKNSKIEALTNPGTTKQRPSCTQKAQPRNLRPASTVLLASLPAHPSQNSYARRPGH
jgi:hypothetical protein